MEHGTDQGGTHKPRQVVEAAKKADELQRQMLEQMNPESGTADTDVAAEGLQHTQEQQPQDGDSERKQKPEGEPQPKSEEDLYWRNRFLSSQGIFSAEKSALNNRIAQLEEEIRNLRIKAETVGTTVLQKPDGTTAANPQATGLIANIEELEQEYGPEIGDLARLQQANSAENELLKQELAKMRGSFEQVTTAQSQGQFIDDLVRLRPDWMVVNDDPSFDNWLYENGLKDTYVRAAESFDAAQVVRFMDMYSKMTTESVQPQGDRNTIQNGQEFKKPPLEGQIQPQTRGAGAPDTQAGGTVYRLAQVQEFYQKKAQRRFPIQIQGLPLINTMEEATAIDNDMMLADMEGRIVE